MPRPHRDLDLRTELDSEDCCDGCVTTRDPVPPTILHYTLAPTASWRKPTTSHFVKMCRSCAVRTAVRLLVAEGLLPQDDGAAMVARTRLLEEDDLAEAR